MIDIQNEKDERGIAIQRVGISQLRYPVSIEQPDGLEQASVGDFTMSVALPATEKGTHMSRFVEALHHHYKTLKLPHLAPLAHDICKRLNAEAAYCSVTFPYFISKKSPVSQQESLMDYEVRVESVVKSNQDCINTITLKVAVATLCPCSKAISAYGAHNQRGMITFEVQTSQAIPLNQLISIIEHSASCELFSLLKRSDEKAVTERAYENPTFVEDLVRNIAQQCRALSHITWYRIHAENFESIHNHNAYALIEAGIKHE